MIALLIGYESVDRFLNPVLPIAFGRKTGLCRERLSHGLSGTVIVYPISICGGQAPVILRLSFRCYPTIRTLPILQKAALRPCQDFLM